MKHYSSYMDRQEVSPAVHEKLLHLEAGKKPPRRIWVQVTTLAACCALMIGVGVWKMAPVSSSAPNANSASQFAAGYTPLPGETDTAGPGDHPLEADSGTVILGDWDSGFVVNSPVEEGTYSFYYMPAIAFPDRTGALQVDASRAYMPGSFQTNLTMEDIQTLFWGAGGIPETYQTELGRQDLPWALFWDGYFVHGSALYDGQGQLIELSIYGEKGRSSFVLELCQGALPFTCGIDLGREDAVTEFQGVEITGWSKVYDQDGDGQTDYICGSEFMTENNIGVRFTSRNNGKVEDGVDGEAWFNTLFIRQALTSGLYLDHLETAEQIPAWREEEFFTLAQARQEAEFAPYLPTTELSGYGDFNGRLSYQEGTQNTLGVRWSRGYDAIEVQVCRDGYRSYHLADPGNPASYDVRLYDIPWAETVPEQYRETVDHPTFRAEDMSLAVVEARGREKDTGSIRFNFNVLHPDGTLVCYLCDGMTAQQVWALVAETLGA